MIFSRWSAEIFQIDFSRDNYTDHKVGVQEVPSSNLGGPTKKIKGFRETLRR